MTSGPCNAEGFPAAQHAQRRRGVCRAHAPGVGLCRFNLQDVVRIWCWKGYTVNSGDSISPPAARTRKIQEDL